MNRFRIFGAAVAMAATVTLGLWAGPAAAEDVADCNVAVGDNAIAACTRVMNSGKYTGHLQAVVIGNRGNAYNGKGDIDKALVDFNQALQIDPTNVFVYKARGVSYNARGEYDKAIADFTRSIQLDANNPYAYKTRAVSYNAKGDYDHAISDATEAIRLDPKDATPYTTRGDAYGRKNDYTRAIQDYTDAIRIDPNYALAFSSRGATYAITNDYPRALIDLNESVRLDPNLAIAASNRAGVFNHDGNYTRGLADATEAIRLSPKYQNAYVHRGISYEGMGQYANALADFRMAVSLQPGYKDALDGIKRVEQKAGNGVVTASRDAPPPPPPPPPAYRPVLTAPADAGRRVALVIGNSAYQSVAALPNPKRDASAVADALRAIGFQTVTLSLDITRDKLTDTLRNFSRDAENADWAVVYYAGHGIEMGGTNYLIPVDAKLETDRDVEFEAIPLDRVMSAVDGARKLRLVLLDACRDNPFASKMRRSIASRSVGRGLASVEPNTGTLVVYAAKHGETAMDGDGGNSPFATALIKEMQVPGLEVRRLFDNVRDDVLDQTNNRQQPFSYGSVSGRQDFYFVAGK